MEIQSSDTRLVARVAQLSKYYGDGERRVTALDDVSIGIRRGQFTAIMGPSGSGKSTLMRVMAGLDSPRDGRVWLGDAEITGLVAPTIPWPILVGVVGFGAVLAVGAAD